jgi:hypothetical protein
MTEVVTITTAGFEGKTYTKHVDEEYTVEDFWGLVYFATTGPYNYSQLVDRLLTDENGWWEYPWTPDTDEAVASADFGSMKLVWKGIEFSLLSMPASPPSLPAFTDSLERAWSEGVEIQAAYFTSEKEGLSDSVGRVYDESLAEKVNKDANVITSKIRGKKNKHKIILDLDYEAALIPTSTPGHYHLMIDKDLDTLQYAEFIEVCHRVGLIADGNMSQWNRELTQFLRLPTVRKAGKNAPKDQSRVAP